MDERHHPYPQQPQHMDARGAAQQQGAPAPWPSYQQPATGAPIHGHAPYPGPGAPTMHQHAQQPQPWQQQAPQQAPHHQHQHQQQYAAPQQPQMAQQPAQYQYAATDGFVQPGAPGGHAQPMSAHGGMIGMPMQASHPDAMPMLHGAQHATPMQHQPQPPMAQHPMAGMPMPMHGGAAMDPYAQPQAWAFPTPNGLQLVQPGMPGEPRQAMARTAAMPAPGARRLKWETIVPGAAVACLIAAVALFISDFDRITGRDTAAPTPVSTAKAVTDTAEAAGGGTSEADPAAVLKEANAAFQAGRFDEAANLLHPLLDAAKPSAAAVALHDRVDAASTRNDALLAQLQRQRRAGKWTAVITTVGQLEALRPLSPNLIKMRQQARAAIKAKAARERARAVAKRKASAPSTSGGGSAPRAGGRTGGSTSARPPATSPTTPASIPPRPDANPISNPGTGASAVGGGGMGSNCHTHDGVTECH